MAVRLAAEIVYGSEIRFDLKTIIEYLKSSCGRNRNSKKEEVKAKWRGTTGRKGKPLLLRCDVV